MRLTIDELIKQLADLRGKYGDDAVIEARNAAGDTDYVPAETGVLFSGRRTADGKAVITIEP